MNKKELVAFLATEEEDDINFSTLFEEDLNEIPSSNTESIPANQNQSENTTREVTQGNNETPTEMNQSEILTVNINSQSNDNSNTSIPNTPNITDNNVNSNEPEQESDVQDMNGEDITQNIPNIQSDTSLNFNNNDSDQNILSNTEVSFVDQPENETEISPSVGETETQEPQENNEIVSNDQQTTQTTSSESVAEPENQTYETLARDFVQARQSAANAAQTQIQLIENITNNSESVPSGPEEPVEDPTLEALEIPGTSLPSWFIEHQRNIPLNSLLTSCSLPNRGTRRLSGSEEEELESSVRPKTQKSILKSTANPWIVTGNC